MHKSIRKIGIFDSGIGGISVLRQLINLPGLEIVYVADTAHVPYGKRTKEEIQILAQASIEVLLLQHVDLIIIACHTVATNALEFLKEKFPTILFIDVVDSVIKQAFSATNSGNIGILGTKATIKSENHKKKLLALNSQLKIFTQACPRLASAVEKDYANTAKIKRLVAYYIKPIIKHTIDTLILGCTHYDLIKTIIQEEIGPKIKIVSAEKDINEKIKTFISPNILSHSSLEWFITGNKIQFHRSITRVLNKEIEIEKIEKIKFSKNFMALLLRQ